MRRSHSNSSIPLPRNLMGQRDGVASRTSARRSHSTNRLSHRDSTSSLKRNPSLEKKSTANRLSKLTPVTNSSRPSSIQKGASLFGSGQRRTAISLSPKSIQEKKSIQKLATDKRWVAEQFSKVQEFVATCPYFDQTVANPNNLKPPSIKTFVHISEVLLQQFFPNILVTISNYKEVIGEKLKLMHYPGTLPNSILKTVNTMHSWPHVIGMFSWLVDKVNLALCSPDISLLYPDLEDKLSYMKIQACRDLILKRYTIFNNNDASPVELSQVNNSYKKNLIDILQVDPEALSNLQIEIEERKTYIENQEKEIQQLMEVVAQTKAEINNMKKEISVFNETDSIKHIELENTISKLLSEKKAIIEKRSVINTEVNSLQETLKKQPCTYECKKELLSKIEELKRAIESKKEKTRFQHKLKMDFDAKVDLEMSKVQQIATEWNRRLLPLAIKEPFLKSLELREIGFHRSEFLTEVKELQTKLSAIKTKVSQESEDIEIQMEKLLDQRTASTMKKIELERLAEDIKEQCQVVAERSAELKLETMKIYQCWEKERMDFLIEQEELQRSSDLNAINEEICQLRMKCQVSSEDMKKYSEKVVAYFVEVNKQVKDTVMKISEIMDHTENKFENGIINTTNKYSEILKKFEELEQLKLMLEKKELEHKNLRNEH